MAVLLLALLATFAVTNRLSVTADARDQARFEAHIYQISDAVQERLNIYIGILRSGTAMMASNPEVNREEFQGYVNRLRLEQYYPGIQGVGFAQRVRAEERELFLREIREERPEFTLHPGGEREDYFPIVFLAPPDERNEAAIGYDMFSEPVRHRAMARSRDLGAPAASGKVTLVQEIDERVQAGFLIYTPVYEGGDIPGTVAERREKLLGFIYSPFRADDLFGGIFSREARPNIHFEVYDGDAVLEENLLHRSPVRPSERPLLAGTVSHEVAGHPWTLSLVSTPDFEKASSRHWVRSALIGGILLSVLFFAITEALARAAARAVAAQRLAVAQREEYHVTLASIGDAVVATDRQGRIAFMNEVAESILGMPRSEAYGQPLRERFRVVDEGTRQPLPDAVETVLMENRRVEMPSGSLLLAADGAERAIEEIAAPIRDGQGALKGVVLVVRDVTARKRTEAERQQARQDLARVESRFRLIVENAKDFAIFTYDRDGRIGQWNPGAESVFGFSATEVLGSDVGMLFTPEDRANGVPEQERSMAARPEGWVDERWLVRKDGSRFFASGAVRPVLDAEGNFEEFAKVVWDTTERKRWEEELEKVVTERTALLTETVSELEAFSYSLSHDLRAPLRAMQSFGQALEEDFGDQLGETGKSYIDRIVSSGRRLDRLIQDVLTYSRVLRSEPAMETIDLDRFIREIVEQYPALNEPHATVRIDSPLLPVRAHESLLSQCISNLLGNAVKFVTPDRKPEIRLSTEKVDGRVRLCVADNGIGIASHQQSRIFRMFERVHSEEKFEGTGIGLAIVQKAAERMGGAVGLESEEGVGSRFWIELRSAT